MNERTQTRLAWVLSAALLAAGWLSRYLPVSQGEAATSCADPTPRAVAVVVSPETASHGEGGRVYVYWLDQDGSAPDGSGPTRPEGSGQVGEPRMHAGWKFAGSSLVGEASPEPLPLPSRR